MMKGHQRALGGPWMAHAGARQVSGNYVLHLCSLPVAMLVARGVYKAAAVRAEVARAALPGVRTMSTSPFRPTSPQLLRATQPQAVATPIIIGCSLIGAYVDVLTQWSGGPYDDEPQVGCLGKVGQGRIPGQDGPQGGRPDPRLAVRRAANPASRASRGIALRIRTAV